jgi:LysM repeat protein
MPAPPVIAARTRPAARRRAAVCLALLLLPAGCNVRDRLARQDVQTLESSVQQMETSIQARQTGLNEQVRELREGQARLESLLEENRVTVGKRFQRADAQRVKDQEDLARRDRAQQESDRAQQEKLQAANDLAARLGERIDTLQKGLQTVNDNIIAVGAFEKKQEERIAQIQENIQGQLKVIVDEVGQENQNLENSIAALRTELKTSQDGLGQLQASVQQLADALATVQGQVEAVAKKQESLRRAPAPAAKGAGGQHTVKAGETLTAIAARYGVSLQALMERNKLNDANDLHEGQKLAIPGQ